ncbi:MAG: hypothetical protein AB2598_20005 [Candidatus Thiodiazotropha sp.]
MPRQKSRKKKNTPEHTFLAITIEDYKVTINTGPNSQILGSTRYVKDDEEHAIVSDTVLELTGVCTDPEDRAGEHYEISLRGGSSDTDDILGQRIRDLHRKNKDGSHEYRQYRGGTYPVYEDPPELGLVEKIRGESRWFAWASVHHQMVTDALILLGGDKPSYVSIHEKKIGRYRWVRSISVQSVDPAVE